MQNHLMPSLLDIFVNQPAVDWMLALFTGWVKLRGDNVMRDVRSCMLSFF